MREEEKREGNVFVGGGMMSGGGGGGLQPSNLAYGVQIAFSREFMEEIYLRGYFCLVRNAKSIQLPSLDLYRYLLSCYTSRPYGMSHQRGHEYV